MDVFPALSDASIVLVFRPAVPVFNCPSHVRIPDKESLHDMDTGCPKTYAAMVVEDMSGEVLSMLIPESVFVDEFPALSSH